MNHLVQYRFDTKIYGISHLIGRELVIMSFFNLLKLLGFLFILVEVKLSKNVHRKRSTQLNLWLWTELSLRSWTELRKCGTKVIRCTNVFNWMSPELSENNLMSFAILSEINREAVMLLQNHKHLWWHIRSYESLTGNFKWDF